MLYKKFIPKYNIIKKSEYLLLSEILFIINIPTTNKKSDNMYAFLTDIADVYIIFYKTH